LRHHPADGRLDEFATICMREVARLNPVQQGVLDVKDFEERQSSQRTFDDDHLAALIEIVSSRPTAHRRAADATYGLSLAAQSRTARAGCQI
jgi:hypothetical protein